MKHRLGMAMALVAAFLQSSIGAQQVVEVGDDVLDLTDACLYQGGVAYNPDADEFLLVALGEPGALALRVDAATGAALGAVVLVGTPSTGVYVPDVVYNPDAQEYLVVWRKAGVPGLSGTQIFGQRLDGATAAEIGPNDFLIGDNHHIGGISYDYSSPAVEYNPDDHEYLVVWDGRTATNEREIRAQRLNQSAVAVGVNDFTISAVGPAGDLLYEASNPDLVYNSDAHEYLVVFSGTVVPTWPEEEIFAQRLAADGTQVGVDDAQISTTAGLPTSTDPSAAYAPELGRYLVVWSTTGITGAGQNWVSGQLLDVSTGVEVGPDDFKISLSLEKAVSSAVAWMADQGGFEAIWDANDVTFSAQREVFARLVDGATGTPVGQQIQLSDQPSGVYATNPAIATRNGSEALVPWTQFWCAGDFCWSCELADQPTYAACAAVAPGAVVRLGTPPNPPALLAAPGSAPVLGQTFEPRIDHAAFMPGAILDALLVSVTPLNVPTPIGTLLCSPTGGVTFTGPAGAPFAVPVPLSCAVVGAAVCAQGLSVGASSTLALTNALDLVIGTF